MKPNTSQIVSTQTITYREVLRYLGTADDQEPQHDVRSCVLDRFKERGGLYDRWSKRDIGIMSDSITRMEDILELRKESPKRELARLTLKGIRRRLEWYGN